MENKSKNRIMDAALQVFVSKGYSDTRMDDIVEMSDKGFLIVGERDRYSEGSLNGLIIKVDI